MPRVIYDGRGNHPERSGITKSTPARNLSPSNTLRHLRNLASHSQHILLRLKSMYPFDLYPDIVTIDVNKVNIITKDIFRTENVHSILIENITNITVGTGLLSATLEIIDSSNYRYPVTYAIKHLRKTEALLARRLIQGLVAAKNRGLDLSICEGKDVLECLNVLGYARGENYD